MKRSQVIKLLGICMVLALVAMPVYPSSTGENDNGTRLTMNADSTEASECVGGKRIVTINWDLLSTGAADAAVISYSVSGDTTIAETAVGLVAAGNVTDGGGWTISGRNKMASGSFTTTELNLAPGEYDITICATQHGSDGRETKRDCTTIHVTVTACNANPSPGCPNGRNTAGSDGQINNTAWCGKSNAMNIHFHGDFGDFAVVTIKEGDITIGTFTDRFEGGQGNGFVNIRSGASCQYDDQWSGYTRQSGKTYTFSIEGNSHSFSKAQTCP